MVLTKGTVSAAVHNSMTTCTFSLGNIWHFHGTYCPRIGVNPRNHIPKFCAFCNFTHFLWVLTKCPQEEVLPDFTLLYLVPTHNTKQTLYCIYKNKKHYKHTSYPTHLKLTVKNKDHAVAEQLIPHGQCGVVYTGWYCSVFKPTDNACAPSVMDDRSANFGAAQYAVKYSNFTLNDKILNLMGKTNNAVPLILNPFHLKGKMLCHIGHLN
jgi:hypothetical protein